MRGWLCIVLALACSAPGTRDASWNRRAASLTGGWAVRFDYTRDSTTERAAEPPSVGSFDLIVNRTLNREYPRIGLPTNYGTYAVDFRRLGGSPSGARVPVVVVGAADDDSVFVFFETDREGFSMQMHGRLIADSVRGSWSASQSRGTIASGTFVMTRR